MTQPTDQPRVLPTVLHAAIGLAAIFFPAPAIFIPARRAAAGAQTTKQHVCFVLDGHLAVWSQWHHLPDDDARRFGRLLRRRPNQMANAEVAGPLLDRLLMEGQLPGCAADETYAASGIITVSPGMPLRALVDAALDLLDEWQDGDRCLPVAKPGPHHTTIRIRDAGGGVQSLADVHYDIRAHHVPDKESIPAIRDAPALRELRVPFAELAAVAAALDTAHGATSTEGYRATAVRRFMAQARRRGDEGTDELDLAAGELNELIAYTGFGKSVVLVETFACWAAQNGVTVSFVVPTNADVLRYAYQIERSLELLNCAATVIPLMSPRSTFDAAETSAHRPAEHGPNADWVWSKLGYGCALAAAGTTTAAVDAWQPGREPCASLHEPRRGRRKDRVVACPWRTNCDKFQLARAACSADIIVTSHANLLLGRLQVPVNDGHGVTDRVTVEEMILRRSQIVVIDEVDTFQQAAIGQAGRGLVLDHAGNTNTQLRRFDTEFGAAFGRVRDEVDANVRDALFLIRYLSENYVSHLAYDRLGIAPVERRRRRGPSRYWVVPRRWDAWLTARLFALPDDLPVSEDQLNMFRSLFPGDVPASGNEPALFAQIRPLLRAVTSNGSGGAITTVRVELDHLLERIPEPDRQRMINRMLRRAILEQVRAALHRLMANTQQLVAAGVESTEAIADALGGYGKWRVTPTGPLGRLVFAFTEHHDDTGTDPTRLSTAAFGGDPHTHTVTLGDTTALAVAGTRRIVLGLSATAYFPLAPHHHVHVTPRWWVRDNNPGTVTIDAAPIEQDDQSLVKISGLEGTTRRNATQLLTRLLWNRRLDAELRRLRTVDPARARILLATTSYDGARHVAEGLNLAGVAASRICLAVRPRPDAPYDPDRHLVTDTGRWLELPADQLEEFPSVDGADILIAPLARVQRGVNIIGEGDRSALGSVWFIVRPIPVIDEPAELVAHIQAKAFQQHPGPAPDPLPVLADRRETAGRYFEEIARRPPYFQSQPHDVKLSVIAEMINGAIQLIGRARRGGTPAVLHLVDGAFLDPQRGTSFATLTEQLRQAWADIGVLDQMRQLYGTTLEAFFDYARQHADVPTPEQPTSGAAPC